MGPVRDTGDPSRALFTNTGDNWTDYKAMVIGWAVANDYEDILQGKGKEDTSYRQKNGIIYVALARSQAEHLRHLIRGVPDADGAAVWKRLTDHFESGSTATMKSLLKLAYTTKLEGCTISEYGSKYQLLFNRLSNAVEGKTAAEVLDAVLHQNCAVARR
jgi:hypothetical protein